MKAILVLLVMVVLVGCSSWSGSKQQIYSTNSVPLEKRSISEYPIVIISAQGPQPSPDLYEILGEVKSIVNNVTIFEKRGKGAVEMLRNEARQAGDGPHCFKVTDVSYGSPGTIKIEIRTKNVGSIHLGCYVGYIRDGKIQPSNMISAHFGVSPGERPSEKKPSPPR